MGLLVTIGLDTDLVERLRHAVEARVVAYPAVPRLYSVEGRTLKWGNRHCGEDTSRASGGVHVEHDTIVEPFVDGLSERILIVGERWWQLHYESADWRKNVKATVTVVDPDVRLVARARATCERLGLTVAGVDYIVGEPAAALLEVNAYPGFDDVLALGARDGDGLLHVVHSARAGGDGGRARSGEREDVPARGGTRVGD